MKYCNKKTCCMENEKQFPYNKFFCVIKAEFIKKNKEFLHLSAKCPFLVHNLFFVFDIIRSVNKFCYT